MCFKPIPELITEINTYLQSWAVSFSHGYPRAAFRDLNAFTRQRLYRHLRRRSQCPWRPFQGTTCTRISRGWGCARYEPPVVSPAHACGESLQESRMRYVADAGNPHVRFDEGEGNTAPPYSTVDVKPQIQALDRTAPLLPLRPGQPERCTDDYQRHGTTSLYAALDGSTGQVLGHTFSRQRAREFRRFLNQMDATVLPDLEVHLILDNASVHKSALIRRWLLRHPRFRTGKSTRTVTQARRDACHRRWPDRTLGLGERHR